jgi:L-arabinose isomerase
LVFNVRRGPAINASLIDLGNRFRLIVNDVDVTVPPEPLPQLPVARAVWNPQPDLRTAAAAWIYAGGAHHTGFSQAVTAAHLQAWADIAGIEFLHIDSGTRLEDFRKEIRWNEASFR